MGKYDDRQRITYVMRQLDEIARSTASQQQAIQLSMQGIADPTLLGEIAEKRMDASLRAHGQTKRRLEFQDVRNMIMGAWVEGFVSGYRFAESKTHG